MNRFERVIHILDALVGGPSSPVGFPHGVFWRGLTRNEFVAKKILGRELVIVGDGASSILVRALKGESPFGADMGVPNADFNRMPSGLAPASAADIAFIEAWINEGCLSDDCLDEPTFSWRKTGAPIASSRTDDIWFVDPAVGWAVNSDGSIIKTTDGGMTWQVQKTLPGVYLRCVGFANANEGWVGTLTRTRTLFHTKDGGRNWQSVATLPAGGPTKICGLSVVNERIMYCAGTNDPRDVPRMLKSSDGGATWTAWDMTAHASVLIDCFFLDALHGWVVGGKATDPPPTGRDKLKPVVLETLDGGQTWINRLAGAESLFPFGEWGWKIQFLNDQIGFVSLENFTAAAILKTIDSGRTWARLMVNDPQGNANLEGVGFIDEQTGWVGGWGSGDFSKGYSSATVDGGASWQDANQIGRFINRFRFFGNPVHTGYASGDTVYKYSMESAIKGLAQPVPAVDGARELLPEKHIVGCPGKGSFQLTVPLGAKRLSLYIWDRFGEEVGCVLDETRPVPGKRVFEWDGRNSQGVVVQAGDYVARAVCDESTASSLVKLVEPRDQQIGSVRRIAPVVSASEGRLFRFTTIAGLVAEPKHDLAWLREALQMAIQIEHATLPPYLTARWTLKPPDPVVGPSIREIRGEEMVHFAVACNLLTSIGGFPLLADARVVPQYPGPLPGGVHPGLVVSLRKLTREQAAVFMAIEYPTGGPLASAAESSATIGQFYESILEAFRCLNPPLALDRQLELDGASIHFSKIRSLAEVEAAINLINLQGEGSALSPEEQSGDLAHYYRFGEIFHGKKLILDESGRYSFSGADVPLPDTWNMADVPEGGYRESDVADPATWDLIVRFDQTYSEMLRKLQAAWTHGDLLPLEDAITAMIQLGSLGRQLVRRPKPDGSGNFGPCFRYVE